MINNDWVRVTTTGGVLPAAGLAGTPLELATAGHSPQSLGMLQLSTAKQRVEIPEIDTFGISLNIPTEARFTRYARTGALRSPVRRRTPRKSGSSAIAQQGRALIVIADNIPTHYPTLQDSFNNAPGWDSVRTAIYVWPDGIGIAASGPGMSPTRRKTRRTCTYSHVVSCTWLAPSAARAAPRLCRCTCTWRPTSRSKSTSTPRSRMPLSGSWSKPQSALAHLAQTGLPAEWDMESRETQMEMNLREKKRS